MSFVNKPFLARVVDAFKDKAELKSPILIKPGESVDFEIARLKQELMKPRVDLKKIEKQIKLLEIGKAGEQSLLFELMNSFLPIMILHDVYIEHKGLKAQFDFIVVTRQFFLVIEVKKYYGDISINEKGEFIRTINRGGRTVSKEGMYSPVRQVERQVEVLRSMLKDNGVIERTPIRFAVAFANDKTVIDLKKAPKQIKDKVFRTDGIVSFLKAELAKKSPVHFFDKRMQDFAEYIKGQHISKNTPGDSVEEEVNFYTEDEIPVAAAVAATVEEESRAVSSEDLELILRDFRKKIAEETERKAFYIFTNKSLDELIVKRPTTIEKLREVQGIGDKKIEEFGSELVKIIKENS